MARLVGQFSGFDQDVAALEKQVKDAFRASRPALAEEMRQCLREHVVEDVYDKLVLRSMCADGEQRVLQT